MANFDPTQVPRRAMRVTSAYPAKRAAEIPPGELPVHTRPQRGRWYMGCAVGMLIIVGILFTVSRIILPWYTSMLNHWSYGDAQVYHVRADLGRGSASDVYTMSESGNVAVVVMMKDKIETYNPKLTTGTATANMLVLVSVIDVNGDGKPDLVLHSENGLSAVLINTGESFKMQ